MHPRRITSGNHPPAAVSNRPGFVPVPYDDPDRAGDSVHNQEETMTAYPQYKRPEHAHGEDDRLLTIEEVAELTRICVATLRWMRHTGTGPHSFRPARRVLYWQSDVVDWIDRNYSGNPQSA